MPTLGCPYPIPPLPPAVPLLRMQIRGAQPARPTAPSGGGQASTCVLLTSRSISSTSTTMGRRLALPPRPLNMSSRRCAAVAGPARSPVNAWARAKEGGGGQHASARHAHVDELVTPLVSVLPSTRDTGAARIPVLHARASRSAEWACARASRSRFCYCHSSLLSPARRAQAQAQAARSTHLVQHRVGVLR